MRHIIARFPHWSAGLALATAASLAAAQSGGTITDGNATFTIGSAPTTGTTTSNPLVSFSTDGGTTDHVFQNWWWYRLSTDTREFSLNSSGGGATSSFAGNVGMMQQNYPSFRADMTWEVESTGATTGFYTSRVTITNTSSSTISISLFNYMDIDLGGSAGGDSASLIAPNLIQITDASTPWVGQYSGTDADNYQVASWPSLRSQLADSDEDNFDNTGLPFGPGDFTGGYQWTNIPVDPGFSRSVVVTFAIPAPGAFTLAGLGALAMIRRRR
jgi:hypothetical protein